MLLKYYQASSNNILRERGLELVKTELQPWDIFVLQNYPLPFGIEELTDVLAQNRDWFCSYDYLI